MENSTSGDGGEPTNRFDVGAAIKKRRKALRITQRELSSRIGRSTPTISKIEAGNHPLDFDTLSKVAIALETTSTRLLWECERVKLSKDAGTQKLIPVLDSLLEGLEQNGVRL